MKIRKKIVITIMAVALIFGLTACGDSPTNVAEKFLEGIKTNNTEAVAETYAGGEINLLNPSTDEGTKEDALFKAMQEQLLPKIQQFDYEVSNEQIDGDKATVDVKIKTYDIGTAFSNFIQEYMKKAISMKLSKASDEEINKTAESILKEQVGKLTEKTYEKTVKLNLTQKDGKWMVDKFNSDSTEVVDALTGGLYSATQKIGK